MGDRFRQHGAFSWCELMTTDPEGARAFYAELLGWKTQEYPMEGMVYTVLSAGDEDVGGIMGMPPGMEGTPPHWGAYVTVADVDATARRAEELGGKVLLPPRDIPDVGRFGLIQDPQGADLSVITYVEQQS